MITWATPCSTSKFCRTSPARPAAGPAIEDELAIRIEDAKLNPRFTAGIIKGVTLKPSPYWMQRRLALCGVRAINNIVDVSNYVMLETGQPTHTFDLHAVRVGPSGKRTIVTRVAHAGETLVTLDGQPHDLLPTDILVCDEVGALSVAGVMGGADSEVKDTTQDVLLEVASWDPISIRKTARHHNFSSEASFRFQRGVHPSLAMLAQKRGLLLLQQHAGGVIDQGILDAYPHPIQPVTVDLHPESVNKLLGVEVPVDEMVRILKALEFNIENDVFKIQNSKFFTVTAPDHRLDIEGEHDLIEEIARIYGYDKLPDTLMRDEIPHAAGNPELEFEERVKDILVSAGLQEIITYRLTTPQTEARTFAPGTPADDRPYVTLLNPMTPEQTMMRHTLVAGVLDVLQSNLRHHNRVALFEVGKVYLPGEEGTLPDELPRLCIALSGARRAASWQNGAASTMDFFDLKGMIEALLESLHVQNAAVQPATHPTFYPGRAAALQINDAQIGLFGELHPKVREQWGFDANTPVLLADIDLVALQQAAGGARTIQDVPRFPATVEDLAMVVNEDVPAADVELVLRRAGGALLRSVSLFDVYRGEQAGAGKKSLAYSLTYQADDRTLGEKDVEKLRAKLIRAVEGQLGATVRK